MNLKNLSKRLQVSSISKGSNFFTLSMTRYEKLRKKNNRSSTNIRSNLNIKTNRLKKLKARQMKICSSDLMKFSTSLFLMKRNFKSRWIESKKKETKRLNEIRRKTRRELKLSTRWKKMKSRWKRLWMLSFKRKICKKKSCWINLKKSRDFVWSLKDYRKRPKSKKLWGFKRNKSTRGCYNMNSWKRKMSMTEKSEKRNRER